jgi:hypothetical protein
MLAPDRRITRHFAAATGAANAVRLLKTRLTCQPGAHFTG